MSSREFALQETVEESQRDDRVIGPVVIPKVMLKPVGARLICFFGVFFL